MKKIVVLTSRFPYPVIGGDRLRIYQICKELAKTYELHLVSLCESKHELDMEVADNVFHSIDRVYQPKWRSYINCLGALVTRIPLQVAYYSNGQFAALVNRKVKECDYALSHLVRTARYLDNTEIPKVLEMTDAISMNYERVSANDKGASIKTLIYTLEQSRLNKFELEQIESFDYTALVSQYDKEYLLKESDKNYNKVVVSSNGVDTNALKYNYHGDSKQLIFIGNLFSVQNLDAALWFAKKVMPLLREHDEYTFKVIGRIKERDKQKFSGCEGVELTGSVDSVADAASHSLAGICSVRLAAGVQNKILEYMALGVPCVSSSIGLEGLEAKPNTDILIADEPEEYVDAIIKLTSSKEVSEKIAIHGRNYVEIHHSWTSKLHNFIEVFGKF
ncbi:glycosyltransferase family 4 protein [Pseudoalteromonas luteoviolacea]|uniref:Glycosyltransferase subfamily 4-like N-terminal domain-containing protein n=1 Tax=Pseudoalteromonas luteoviolacea H33 TaxID=1365251 RepID=A0A162AKD7_9GAMM|nr:glycosyltransferase family 4 protein [Pseudoalteromonas luteoviolacea]KZN51378.1 hypothetical protein N476_13400 [Pseudoalteromonas luteoviolacea H33]KZN71451.1 hypothetical protein N477_04020 [Pseudoalteromonas luteoviolacea H33-S]MBQ4876807.1 glycosyltransferase [Pseudoalteromonas luteoviolacea]MBQ4905404.1 glycosyltransferase [Pseudoalteromonas luteoviolacea]